MTGSFLYCAMRSKDMPTSYKVLILDTDPDRLLPFEEYANATLSLGNPSSAGHAKHRARGLPGAGRRRYPKSAFRHREPQRRTGRWLALKGRDRPERDS